MKQIKKLATAVLMVAVGLTALFLGAREVLPWEQLPDITEQGAGTKPASTGQQIGREKPEEKAWDVVEEDWPGFTEDQMTRGKNSFVSLGALDRRGRCTACTASLSRETMPAAGQEREDISMVHPSGWRSGQGWERCHLIAFQFSGLNAEKRNLITGTHEFNVSGMLPFENQVAEYIRRTGNHVLYRVTPKFRGKEMVARSVEMEALSVEDRGRGVSYHVEVYNRSPGAEINYRTGEVTSPDGQGIYADEERVYVVNINTGRFHYPSCNSAKATSEKNRREVKARRSELIKEGYTPCGNCEP